MQKRIQAHMARSFVDYPRDYGLFAWHLLSEQRKIPWDFSPMVLDIEAGLFYTLTVIVSKLTN